jgi:DNA-binding NarL/FixJ family response regulator
VGEPIRVLVVEDNASVLRLVEIVLSLEPDIDVVGSAERADEALALADTVRPDVVVLDNQMPGRAGLEIMDELRSLGTRGIVVYTAETNPEIEALAEAAEAELCVKNGDMQLLVEAIRRAALQVSR